MPFCALNIDMKTDLLLMNRRIVHYLGLAILFVCLLHEDADAQRRRRKAQSKLTIYDIDTLINPIPLNRKNWHDKIDIEQKKADVSDGYKDNLVYYSEDTSYTNVLTNALLGDVDRMQIMIENMPAEGPDLTSDHQAKLRYLSALSALLQDYNTSNKVEPFAQRRRVNNMRDLMIAKHENRSVSFVRNNINVYTLDNVKALFPQDAEERKIIYTEMGKREPEMMIKRLSEYANDPFADNIIAAAARVVPNEVFNFATSTNYTLSGAVRRTKDPLVQTIVRIAQQSKSPLKAMPFLSDVHNNRLTIPEIDAITDNPDLFYQNLVRLKVSNESLGGNAYTDELRYRGLKYVREMNDLHDKPDAVRFKCIDGFSPVALYFIMVYGQDEIYTSSFLGTFKRMMERMKPMTGDQLLDTLHRDRFRTFIRMCAGYNTLSTFLASIETDKKSALMKDFIANLEKGKEDDLEDAVDVADAFGSINDKDLTTFLQEEVKNNYERSYKARSRKGVILYGLLATLFESGKNTDNDNVAKQQSERLNLPPINLVPYTSLVNDSGIVYEQFFFYGDDDGKSSYNSFLGNFRNANWKITTSEYWTTIRSVTGKPVVIYANLPLEEPRDEEAQQKLVTYLQENNIRPSIMVHRGHSYHLPLTMDRLIKESRIVMLGSCGGYHNLGTVLDRSPDAHIISSKQVGSMSINEPIIKAINDQLLAGKNIDWINTWKGLNAHFSTKKMATVKSMFDDYVPPHKNLGVIFIKAYRKQFNSDEEDEG
jgi:hypothetical protein